jgi:hypothetical protein
MKSKGIFTVIAVAAPLFLTSCSSEDLATTARAMGSVADAYNNYENSRRSPTQPSPYYPNPYSTSAVPPAVGAGTYGGGGYYTPVVNPQPMSGYPNGY